MLKIGLTGGIGSGKSVVAKIFSVLGTPVYYADSEARRLMNTDPELMQTIVKLFGDEAYRNGELNRAFIGCRVFDNPSLLKKLNAAVHPAVKRDFIRWCDRHNSYPYIIEEAAVLVESGAAKLFDYLVVVSADVDVRIRRVRQRDGLGEKEIRDRMNSQMLPGELNKHADFIIYNNGNELLIPRVLELHRKFVSLHIS